MIILLFGMLAAFSICYLLVRFNRLHENFFNYYSDTGPQKFHSQPTPRIGGIAIAFGLCFSYLLYNGSHHDPVVTTQFGYLLLAAMPAFSGGVVEDISKRVSVLMRLMLAILSAAMGIWLLSAVVIRLDIAPLDWLLHWPIIAILFTLFSVGGVVNGINIIDGFNGIASVFASFMLLSIAYVAFTLEDTFLVTVALAMLGPLLGFLFWNYPQGKIFLGDGGSYLVGFWLAELVVLIVARHPQLSPWFAILLLVHPVFETIFSVYRRKVLRGKSPWLPDGLHLHTLIFRRLNHRRWASRSVTHKTHCNSMTAPYFWVMKATTALLAVLFRYNSLALIALTLLFVFFYVWLYWRIVKFKTPRWLVKYDRRRLQLENAVATELSVTRDRRSNFSLTGVRLLKKLFRRDRRHINRSLTIYQQAALPIQQTVSFSPENERA